MRIGPLAGQTLTLGDRHVVDTGTQRVMSVTPAGESVVVADRGVYRWRAANDALLSRVVNTEAIAQGFDSRLLRVSYPAQSCSPGDRYRATQGGSLGANRPEGGMSFSYPMPACERVRMRYGFVVPVGFDWRWGGKLPGVSTPDTQASGGQTDPAVAGVLSCTARMMWRPGGLITPYFYMGDNRDARWVNTGYIDPAIPQATWQDAYYSGSMLRANGTHLPASYAVTGLNIVEIEIWMNTPGFRDGYGRCALNGVNIVERSDLQWRNANGGALKWERAFVSSFFGGSTSATWDGETWFTAVDTSLDFTDIHWEPIA